MNKKILLFLFTLTTILQVNGQSSTLNVQQQNEDFTIFKGGLQEGHSGLYYFISKSVFEKKCDSIQNTFSENTSAENYYLKLRYLITSLNHGHTRISLPTKGNVNFKMAVLDSTKLYLPFQFLIINKQLIIKEDCSKEQLFPKYSVIKSINNVPAIELLERMSFYIPADGINQTFKYYTLYNYYYFHYLFNLFYPDKKGISIVLETNSKRSFSEYYIELLKPKVIENNYFNKNGKGISQFNKQLSYKSDLPNKTAYLKIGSFYNGFIESLGQKYEPFLDSAFTDIKNKNLKNLILDLRDNEGGGDYHKLLLSYLSVSPTKQTKLFAPGREFKFTKYAVNIAEDLTKFIANPDDFLVDKSSLELKGDGEPNFFPIPKNSFFGRIVVLTNGGSFSASTFVISDLYTQRKNTNRKILFIGGENGGDIYCNSMCAGLSYVIKLPNSSIEVDMPLLCFGEFKRDYPKKRLPDYEVFDKISDLKDNKGNVLDFAIKKCSEK